MESWRKTVQIPAAIKPQIPNIPVLYGLKASLKRAAFFFYPEPETLMNHSETRL
jgi:hypothetical protein